MNLPWSNLRYLKITYGRNNVAYFYKYDFGNEDDDEDNDRRFEEERRKEYANKIKDAKINAL